MKEGKLSKSDVTRNFIVLEDSVRGLFEHLVGHKIKIIDQDDCEFFFDVRRYNNGQLFLYQTQGFINQWNLKECDEVFFDFDDKIGSFIVNITEKGNGNIGKKKEFSNSNTVILDKTSKEDLIKTISDTYKSVVGIYKNTFNERHYLPTKKANSSLVINGFTERNLTFNFCHAYLKQNEDAIVWQEIPIIDVARQHVDSIIIDKEWVIFLEAKRLYDITHFEFLLDDLKRIKKYYKDIPLPLNSPSKKIVVLLADHYYNGECKKKEYKDYYYDRFFSGQDVKSLSEIEEDYPKLLDKIASAKISKVNDIQTINIQGDKNCNIPLQDELIYSIYCGAYFIDGTEKP